MKTWIVLLVSLLTSEIAVSQEIKVDPKGYIMFCPCMGRFGNQMDQFLGALAFAKALDRTLVLPHLIEYPDFSSVQIPFQTYFKVEPLKEYTKVILMDEFMTHLAPTVWPKGKRTVFCYSSRDNSNTCNAKDGNPFGPFWDNIGVDFDKNEFYAPLSFDPAFERDMVEWKRRYAKQPVLAFTGAPGAFPVAEKHVHLQKYLKWSDLIDHQAQKIIDDHKQTPSDTFIAIHLRNGIDFKRACEHAKQTKDNFFGSAQCLGYRREHGEMTEELCYPSDKTIFKQLKKAIEKYNPRFVYIATDDNDMIVKFSKKFKDVKFIKNPGSSPHVDLCALGKADHTIVNCVSTFSAFAKRQRDSENKTTEFWAFKPKRKSITANEL